MARPPGREDSVHQPGSPWESGYNGSFNGELRDELLNREIFYTLTEAKVLIQRRQRESNTFRPHRSLGYRPPAPEATQWPPPANMGTGTKTANRSQHRARSSGLPRCSGTRQSR